MLGVRETRRIRGEYVLTEGDVRAEARFEDAVGLCNSSMDVHEPGDSPATMINLGAGYGIPITRSPTTTTAGPAAPADGALPRLV